MKRFIIAIAAVLTMSGTILAQPPDPLPGARDMAEALYQRHPYVCQNTDRKILDAIRRDLREAEHFLQQPTATEQQKNDALAKREKASKEILQVLSACLNVQVIPMTGEIHPLPPLPPVNLPGDATAFLFRLDQGEGPVRCLSKTFDLSVDAGIQFPIEVKEKGTTWILAALERVPQGRTSLRFRFIGDGVQRKNLAFETVTIPHGILDISVLSDDSGAPAPSMMRIAWKTDDSEVRPANAEDFGLLFDKQGNASGLRAANIPGKLGQRYWCVPGPFQMALPPGEYDITVLRGIEHAPVQDTITVQSNQTVQRTYRPQRWVNMTKRGWYSGDDHVHTQILSDRDARMVMNWIQAEDVRLANVVKMGDIFRTWFEQRGFGKAFRVEDHGYIISPGQECPRTHEELGHTLSMNIKHMVRDTDQYYLY